MAQAVPGGEAHRTKINYVDAERAPEALMDPSKGRARRARRRGCKCTYSSLIK